MHVYPFKDEGAERIRSQVFDKRSATAAPTTSSSSGQSAIQFKDEGGNVGAAGAITSVDFVGSGISAAVVGTALTVTASGGGGAASAGAQVGYARTIGMTLASTTDTTLPRDATIPQIGEGVAYASLDTTITPTDAASLIEVEVMIPYVTASGASVISFALFRDASANAIAAASVTVTSGGFVLPMLLRTVVTAGSTSATTFKLRWSVSGGTGYLLQTSTLVAVFGTANVATMTAKEVKQ